MNFIIKLTIVPLIIFNYVNALERYIKYTDEDPSKTSGYDKKTRCIVKLFV